MSDKPFCHEILLLKINLSLQLKSFGRRVLKLIMKPISSDSGRGNDKKITTKPCLLIVLSNDLVGGPGVNEDSLSTVSPPYVTDGRAPTL